MSSSLYQEEDIVKLDHPYNDTCKKGKVIFVFDPRFYIKSYTIMVPGVIEQLTFLETNIETLIMKKIT
jgi:hypothetical protein